MPNKNYIAGAGFEARLCKQLVKDGDAVVAKRFYASKGITDIYWVSFRGIYVEAQLKYSKKKPYITSKELDRLKQYATKMPFPVYLVTKQSRKPAQWRLM